MSEQVLDQILQEMRQGFATVNGRLDRVDERLESLEGRMDRVEVRLDALEGRLDRVEVRLDALEGRLDRVEGRLDALEGRLDRVEGRLDALEGRLDYVEGRLDALETGQAGLRQAVVELQESANRIENVQQQQSEAIASLRKERSIDRRMLEALTVKYIEHEAEIRALKQA